MKQRTMLVAAFLLISTLQITTSEISIGIVHASDLTFSGTQNLSNDPDISDFPLIASANNNVYVTWLNSTFETSSDVLFVASSNNGTSFGPVTNLSNNPTGASTDQQIAAVGNYVYIVWADNATGNDEIYFLASGNKGASFDPIVNLSNSSGSSTLPRMMATGTNVYVSWQDEVPGPPGSTDVFFIASADGGANFASSQNLSNDGVSTSPEIAATGTNVYVAWQNVNGGLNDLFFKASTNNGVGFGSMVNLSNNPASPAASAIAQKIIVIASKVYVTWMKDTATTDDVIFRASTNNGNSFGVSIPLTNNGGSTNPDLAATGTYVHVVWEDHSVSPGVSTTTYARSTNDGANFAPTVPMSSSTGFSASPEIIATGTNVHIAWEDSTGSGDTFLVSSSDSGASFGTRFNLSNNAGFSSLPRLAATGNRVYVAWQDDSSGNDDILFTVGSGKTPLQQHTPILITGNTEFSPANGVVRGTGAPSDPYVIEGWEIDASSAHGIRIENTNVYFVVRNVKVFSGVQAFTGVVFKNVSNGHLANSTILNNFKGIQLESSSSVVVDGNTIPDNRFSIVLFSCNDITFIRNKISNSLEGISISFSTGITIQSNIFTTSGVLLKGSSIPQFDSHTITQDNLVNGRPLYYYKDCADQKIRDMTIGQLIVANCTRFDASNLNIRNSSLGIEMAYVDTGSITNSDLSSNSIYGIFLAQSTTVTVSGNTVSSSREFGIRLESSQNIIVTSNSISSNPYGIFLFDSQGVQAYHNNLSTNGIHAFDGGGTENSWNNNYPIGGNYWSGYAGSDNCNGPGQNICPGSDGIGDTPYAIDPDSLDHYPLTQPYPIDTNPPSWPPGSSLTTSNIAPTSLTLTWSAAVDNVAVAYYRIYQGTTIIATLDGTTRSHDVTGLTIGAMYSFKVEAGDDSSNWSLDGPSTSARTKSAPVLAQIGAKTVDEETPLVFTASAMDVDGESLTFSLGTAPAGASITLNGAFSWTPSEDQGAASYTATIIVSDGSLSDSETFTITVRELNKPPTLSPIGEKSIVRGTTLTFNVAASDPDIPAQTLVFSLAETAPDNFPIGASITPEGVFTWSPSSNQAPGTYLVRIIVSDGNETDSELVTITISEGSSFPSWLPWIVVGVVGLLASSLGIWIWSKKKIRIS